MKEILVTLALVACVVAEPQAPYPPSGYRPNGPAFELPQRPQKVNAKPQYLPPIDPRRPLNPPVEAIPEDDLSVQGLPVQGLPGREPEPIFQGSPINGPQYTAPAINTDIRTLDNTDNYRQYQYEQQQRKYLEIERQRQYDIALARKRGNQLPAPQVPRQNTPQVPGQYTPQEPRQYTPQEPRQYTPQDPRQYTPQEPRQYTPQEPRQYTPQEPRQYTPQAPRQYTQAIPTTTESTFSTRTTEDSRAETTTEVVELNEGETLDENKSEAYKKSQVSSVEVTKQKLQEYPGDLYLNSLAQLQLQPQFFPYQPFAQLRAPLFYQPSQQLQAQKQIAGYDAAAHFAALTSLLSQRQTALPQPQSVVNPLVVPSQDQAIPSIAPQPDLYSQYQPVQPLQGYPSQPQFQGYQPVQPLPAFQPVQPQVEGFQPQTVNQDNQDSRKEEVETTQEQEQFVYQQSYQPQEVIYQPQAQVPQYPETAYGLPQAQLINYQTPIIQPYQSNLVPQQFQSEQVQVSQKQQESQNDAEAKQQGNGVEEDKEDPDDYEDDGSTAIAIATAYGTRTQPRVFASYGVPNKVAANPEDATESANPDEDYPTDTPTVAVANAVAKNKRKSAKLRSRRVRPTFTLDRNGRLILATDRN